MNFTDDITKKKKIIIILLPHIYYDNRTIKIEYCDLPNLEKKVKFLKIYKTKHFLSCFLLFQFLL